MFKTKFGIKSLTPNYLVNALTIFLSAFLLFQIQPMIGKSLLPWFGGTTAVWATSLMFFTTALFVGYLYVYFVSKIEIKKQATLHLFLLLLSAAFVIFAIASRKALVIPLGWTSNTTMSPSLAVTVVLLLSVGLPYTVLATTSPLVQHWFSVKESKEPYHLYAISNVGSFLALLSYPFFFERIATLQNQQQFWSASFLIFVVICSYIAFSTLNQHKSLNIKDSVSVDSNAKMPWIRWILFSGFPAFMLVATTTIITQNIAPVPLLWIIPLSIYLLTFVLAYSGFGNGDMALAGLAVFTLAAIAQTQSFYKLLGLITIYSGFLFFVGLVFQSRAYALRPRHDKSSVFYLFGAIGGALGTITASIVPPLIFKDIYEFKLGLIVVVGFLLYEFYKRRLKDNASTIKIYSFRIGVSIASLILISMLFLENGSLIIYEHRSFFGHNVVRRSEVFTLLENNGTTHGLGYNDPSKGIEPTSYYSKTSGIGMAFDVAQKENATQGLDIGTIGLGAGTMAAYCRPGDSFQFYEIDKNIEFIAKKYFNFLPKCDDVQIKIGDGRISLEREQSKSSFAKYDLLSIDAFSGDSVPTHLLTVEAMKIYERSLATDRSIIAFHVSNSYLDLKPVVVASAAKLGFHFRIIISKSDKSGSKQRADWVLLSKDDSVFADKVFNVDGVTESVRKIPAWTDEKADILSVLKY